MSDALQDFSSSAHREIRFQTAWSPQFLEIRNIIILMPTKRSFFLTAWKAWGEARHENQFSCFGLKHHLCWSSFTSHCKFQSKYNHKCDPRSLQHHTEGAGHWRCTDFKVSATKEQPNFLSCVQRSSFDLLFYQLWSGWSHYKINVARGDCVVERMKRKNDGSTQPRQVWCAAMWCAVWWC